MESATDLPEDVLDWNELRSKLHLSPEPAIDPDTVEIDELHLSRLALVPIDRLDDERLLALYRHSVKWGLRQRAKPGVPAPGRAAVTLDEGAGRADQALRGPRARSGPGRASAAQAEHWLAKGRQAESPQKRSAHSLAWEMIGLQVKNAARPARSVGSRARGHPRSMSRQPGSDVGGALAVGQFGLVQAGVDPKRPDQLILDTRILEQYLKRYGPRVTTATGELGVAASQGEIWTPEVGQAVPRRSGLRARRRRLREPRKNRSSSCPGQ